MKAVALLDAATQLPVAGCTPTAVLYLIKRTFLPDHGKVDLGVWEIPN